MCGNCEAFPHQEKTVEITELKAKLHDKANVEEHLASANNKISEYERQVIFLYPSRFPFCV